MATFGQSQQKISQLINEKKSQHVTFIESGLFTQKLPDATDSDYESVVRKYSLLEFHRDWALNLLSLKPRALLLDIPSNNGSYKLELIPSEIFTPDFKVVAASNSSEDFLYEGGLHFRGIISGDNSSVCAISIFKDEVMGFISSPSIGNIVIGKLKDKNFHILYNDKDLIQIPSIECFTEDKQSEYKNKDLVIPTSLAVNCMRLYWEVNYDVYQDKGSVTNATNYVVGLFNQSAILYANDGIPVELSQVFVWDVPSPYTGSSTITLLNQFQSYRNSFAGDLGHLMGYAGGGGVAASTSGLCANNIDYSQCYSGIGSSFQNVPTFSFTVEVVTHEQGHLMGSRHTHACVWNGNNTAIDGCGPAGGYPFEGSCSGAPIPSTGGTIMSYCHLVSAGINFSNGFGPQPTAVILNNYNNAACLSPCVGGTFCSAVSNLHDSVVTTNSAILVWSPVGGAVGYYVQYRETGTSVWNLDSTINPVYNASSLSPGIYYEWQVQTKCSSSVAVYSGIATFITVPLVCNSPTGLTTTNISSVTARFNWTGAQAAIGYIIRYRIVGSPSWTTDTINATTYQAHGLIINTNYEWQVQTICAGGGTSAFSSSVLFTTLDAGAPVTITLQPDGECGKDALLGSNVPSGENIRNFGDAEELNALAWTAGGSSSNQRSLLQFDLSFIPAGSSVTSATLSLYFNTTSTNPGHSTASGPNNCVLNRVTAPWDEHQVTWVSQPPVTTLHQATLPASTSNNQNYPSIDVRDLVQDMVDDPEKNYGMMLQLVTEINYRSLVFATSDHPDVSLRPKLEVTYAPNKTECIKYQYSNCEGTDAIIGDCIAAGYDTSNFGNNPEFDALAWTYSGTNTDLRSLIHWNFTEIPTNATVTSATIDLFWNPTSSNTGHSSTSGPNESYIRMITSPWSENTVTWNTRPTVDTAMQVLVPTTVTNQDDISIDVKNIVQYYVANPNANYGFMFQLKNESYFRSMIFCSSDHPDPARHPRINICYTIPTNTPQILPEDEIRIINDYANEDVKIIFAGGAVQNMHLELINILGKTIRRFDVRNTDVFTFNTSELSAGVYFIGFTEGNKTFSKKIVVR